MSMHNIQASGHIIIGGFGKTVADMREFVRLADELRIPDEQPCNAVVNCRVDAEHVQPSTFGAYIVLHLSKPGGE